MTNYDTVLSERDGDTVTIWMNQPDRLNVLTLAMMRELTDAFNKVGASRASGVILAGKGRLFSAGHDFTEMVDASVAKAQQLFAVCAEMMSTMQSIPQPVIARVHALATGAGCQLVATADLAVASDEATFCTPGGKGGLFCTTPLVAVGRSISRKRAMEMAMSGDPIDAKTALAWGLVNDVVPAADLDGVTSRLLARVTRGSTSSKAIGKRAFYAQMDMARSEAYGFASDIMARASQSNEAQEGIAAFIEKREPKWD
jgi:enoyl-CoA hydratase/carnithine racemase